MSLFSMTESFLNEIFHKKRFASYQNHYRRTYKVMKNNLFKIPNESFVSSETKFILQLTIE